MAFTALVPVANGTEEIEAVCIIDTLRRAGIAVIVASVETTRQVTCSREVKLVADAIINDLSDQEFDLIAVPGGMPGAERLRDNACLTSMLMTHANNNRLLGAICAAPVVVLQHHGLLGNRRATCFPSFASLLENADAASERVVVDGSLVTGRGAGSAIEFALALVERLCGLEKAHEISARMQVKGY